VLTVPLSREESEGGAMSEKIQREYIQQLLDIVGSTMTVNDVETLEVTKSIDKLDRIVINGLVYKDGGLKYKSENVQSLESELSEERKYTRKLLDQRDKANAENERLKCCGNCKKFDEGGPHGYECAQSARHKCDKWERETND
jgi:histidyl-tRNA synthetase